jgi:hypothetical protein
LSRETNSSSSGPHGRGGPPYAPGSEPYGSDAGEPSERAAADADAQAAADEPKTETTMTTRIRINIPGSRPIPPVVMRKTVDEEEDAEPEGGDAAGDAGSRYGTAADSPAGGASGAAGAGASGSAAGSGPASGAVSGGAPGTGGGESTATSDWFAPRKPPRPTPESEPPPEPGQSRTATPPDGVPSSGGHTVGGLPRRGGPPGLLDGPPPGPLPERPPSPAASTPRTGTPSVPPSGSPTGSTTGPRTGDMPVPPSPGGPTPADPPVGPPPGPGAGYDPFGRPVKSGPSSDTPSPSLSPQGPGGSDDERIASDTLVSGVPRVPSVDSVFPPDAPAPRPTGHGYFDDERDDRPDPEDDLDRGDRDDGGRKGKGRSKLALAAVSLVGVAAIAYGAGLLLDHADVPNGTTVLGVDIGGKSQQDAVNTLDAALESRMTDPLTLVVDGKEKQLKPEILGLAVNTDETVREASGRDYNPVSVIGSLFGGSRVVKAQVEVDAEKLRAAVEDLAPQTLGGAEDGMVEFTGGTAEAVPGRPHKAVDVDEAVQRIEAAYRDRAASGQAARVTLPTVTRQPAFGEKELRAAVDGFGKTAMSGWVWVRAGGVEVPFSEQTIGGFLTMTAGGETLQPTIDLDKLAAAYGSAFDGVVVEGGGGTVPVQPKHVAAAMIDALRDPAPPLPQKRVAEVTAARSR